MDPEQPSEIYWRDNQTQTRQTLYGQVMNTGHKHDGPQTDTG